MIDLCEAARQVQMTAVWYFTMQDVIDPCEAAKQVQMTAVWYFTIYANFFNTYNLRLLRSLSWCSHL